MNERIYSNNNKQAEYEIDTMLDLLSTGKVRPLIGFDLETSPMPGLEGYPGTVLKDDGSFANADKKAYLSFVQTSWAANFDPVMLRNLGIFIPTKTTSGKEGDLKAGDAWHQCLAAVE